MDIDFCNKAEAQSNNPSTSKSSNQTCDNPSTSKSSDQSCDFPSVSNSSDERSDSGQQMENIETPKAPYKKRKRRTSDEIRTAQTAELIKRKMKHGVKQKCDQKCVKKCSELFTEVSRVEINRNFWNQDWADQKTFIVRHVSRKECTRRRVTNSTQMAKSFTF